MPSPELTIVLARTTADASLTEALEALVAGTQDVDCEILLVGGATPDPHDPGTARHLPCPDVWLTPERWGAGARAARGRVVAFTTEQLRVGPGWARALVEALDAGVVGVVGVGGPITLDPRADAGTAAAHLIRFSAFLPAAHREPHRVDDVAGDNAAYLLAAVAKHPDLLAEGFWEVEFHRRFAAEGLALEMVPDATAVLVGPVPTSALAHLRYVHAREFGAARVRRHGASRWSIALAAPLVPFVLLSRMRQRARADAATASRFNALLPRLAWLAIAWAAGEAVGAITARPDDPAR